ncbi:phosphoribosylformylglycinamidine synthase [Candidatus Nomurabacteria bacterium]|nr:phosphoribosylformylglycinamidine synthase [Candidatus Nomurabacteria bacterium]
MISRIYITGKVQDSREEIYLKSWRQSGFLVSGVKIVDSYLLEHSLSTSELTTIAGALTNPTLENFSINKIPQTPFKYLIEIGFKPGVTDNVGHTAKETITDLLHLKQNTKLVVYTSKVFLISGKIKIEDVKHIAASLHNPLIETSFVEDEKKVKNNLPLKIPQVILKKLKPVIPVSLNVDDEELINIGKEGIIDETGVRRGPLALDLLSMQAIQSYFKKLNRAPNDIELESLAQTWSEHCKHTIFANPIDDIKDGLYKTYIKGATNLIRKQKGKNDFCVSVFSDNAGGIVFDKDYLITHKVETHNSPSALDPFGGAITGIGGVNRDAIGFGLGAKPVVNTYGFCFGYPDDKRKFFRDKNLTQEMLSSRRIIDGVVKGINVGGNCSGIPTISGFLKFDDRFRGKPLVFAGTVGLIPIKIKNRLSHEKKALSGDYVVMVGGRVGLDGIHGATFSSVKIDSSSPATAVQIGDPITQKKLSDAIVKEARDLGLYNSITDNGAGGLSSSVAEMAKECGGVKVYLDKVPLKYPGLRPWEIWISESQERMTLSVPKKNWKKFKTIMESRGVEATAIGEFTDSGKCVVAYKGKKIMDMELEFLHNGLPKRHLITEAIVRSYENPKTPKNFTKTFEELLSRNNVAGSLFVSEQYDHEVQASSVLKPLSGAGRINTEAQVFKPVLTSNKGVVLATGICPSYSDINTYHMAACALDTAIRNAVTAGAKLSHLAILDNFCWCSSYDKTRLAELLASLRACYDYAVGYGTPFISGKDSMFNDFSGYDERGNAVKISIPPTLLISAIGVMPDLNKTVSPEFKKSGDIIYLLGDTNDELGGSEYYRLLAEKEGTNNIGNNVPKINLEKNLKTYKKVEQLIEKELLNSSISVTLGGLGIALVKASVGGMLGCNISLKNISGNAETAEAKLFSESQGRILVSVSPRNTGAFEKLLGDVAFSRLGKVSSDKKFIITDKEKLINTDVKALYKIYHSFSNKMK